MAGAVGPQPLASTGSPMLALGIAPAASRAVPGPVGFVSFATPSAFAEAMPAAIAGGAGAVARLEGLVFRLGAELYRFAAADSGRGRKPDEELVPHAEAVTIVDNAAREHAHDTQRFDLFKAAAAHLRTTGQSAGGFFLLRMPPPTAPAPPVETPKLPDLPKPPPRPAPDTTWIEIRLRDEHGAPIKTRFILELPDGSKVTGESDDKGHINTDGFEPGKCKLTLPDLDAATWSPA